MRDAAYERVTAMDPNIFKYEFNESSGSVHLSGERDLVIGALLTSLEFRPHCIFDHNQLDVTIKYKHEPQHETVTYKVDLAISG